MLHKQVARTQNVAQATNCTDSYRINKKVFNKQKIAHTHIALANNVAQTTLKQAKYHTNKISGKTPHKRIRNTNKMFKSKILPPQLPVKQNAVQTKLEQCACDNYIAT